MNIFQKRLKQIQSGYEKLISRPNVRIEFGNGIYERYQYPILTAAHAPVFWEYDLDPDTNPFLMKRFEINATFNAGAIKLNDTYLLVARVEGADRKSFFAVAESPNGVDQFTFWDFPVHMPETGEPDGNVYDMRLTQHEDGWIYGLFCTERKDPGAKPGDESAAIAQCAIARTRDLKHWERLPDLITHSPQQRNVVLHPEFIQDKYAFYTRPQDGFITAGSGGGIAMGFAERIENAKIDLEHIIDPKRYHTIYEVKNGLGPPPLKTTQGWLHLAHGVRQTAAGLRYVLYLFLTDLLNPAKITHKPAGYFLAPQGEECIGDVSNVVFCNGWILDDDGHVFIYYASSDCRTHVATSTLERLLNYVSNTPADGFSAAASRKTLHALIEKNLSYSRKTLLAI
ncbi:glycoside hydrolase family 130 protein [Dyadobacter psychrophilus]|uniref:4-O-beta-D-mannosyl-D-glucose phosphorylase n=1 Tax=Dyadobacter psychrophilus TaxID=651661 RepID=A0A1T5HAL2_9BACT|nr:glycosidase [Dyadobacter psychrophilus]SKC17753.1 4-O-beta-D-mannosyl-D-glucose phosphorylase [Dyadobacter psychrophilus]